MSRELKVKAWDKLNEEWVHIKSLNLWDDEGLWYMEDFDGEVYFSTHNDWTLVKYTGLKDKNGVEIYEGYILDFTLEQHYDGIYQEMNYKQPIVFSEGSFWAGNNLLHAVICADEELRVIGSIYENPELLEEITK